MVSLNFTVRLFLKTKLSCEDMSAMLNLRWKLLIFLFRAITTRRKSFCDSMFNRVLIYFYIYRSLIMNNILNTANTRGYKTEEKAGWFEDYLMLRGLAGLAPGQDSGARWPLDVTVKSRKHRQDPRSAPCLLHPLPHTVRGAQGLSSSKALSCFWDNKQTKNTLFFFFFLNFSPLL